MKSKASNKKETRPLCEAKTKTGLQCRGHVVKGSKFCNLHDPRWAKKVAAGRKSGGRIPRAKTLLKEWGEIKNPQDLLNALNRLSKDVYSQKIPAKTAQALVSVLSGIKSTLEGMFPGNEQEKKIQITIIPSGRLPEPLPEPPKELAEVIEFPQTPKIDSEASDGPETKRKGKPPSS